MPTRVSRVFAKSVVQYCWAIAAIALATLVRRLLVSWVGVELPPYLTFYPAVIAVGTLAGFWPGILSIVLTALVVDLTLLAPVGHLKIQSRSDAVAMAFFIVVGAAMNLVFDSYRQRELTRVQSERKLALEEAQGRLVQSERRFEMLANSIPQLCWMADSDGRAFWYNSGWYEYTGTTLEQMQGTRIRAFQGPESRSAVIEKWEISIATGMPFEMVYPLRRHDGEFRQFLTRVSPVRDDQGKVLRWFATSTDIDDQVRTEDALRSSKAKVDLAIDVVRVGEWDADMVQHTGTHSARHAEIFGYPSPLPEWTYDMFLHHIVPERRDDVKARVLAATAAADLDFETSIHRVDGELRYIWVHGRAVEDEDGRVVRMFGTVIDVTERKRGEEALMRSEAQLRLFVEHAPAALAMFDDQMRYLRISHRWATDFSIGDRDLTGLSHYDVFPFVSEQRKELHRRALAGEVLKSDGELFTYPDGHMQWLRWEMRPWQYAGGSIGGILIFSEDITERKRIEEQLQKISRTQAVLSDVNQTIVREKDIKTMLQAACHIAVDKGNFRMAWVGLIDPITRKLRPVASSGIVDGYFDQIQVGMDKGGVPGPASRCIQSGQHMVYNDIATDPAYVHWRDAASSHGYGSAASLPIKVNGDTVGAFVLYSSRTGFFDDEELLLLDEMAMDISFALDVAELESQRLKVEEELKSRTAFFEALMESSIDGIMVKDASGNVIFRNRSFIELWGFPEGPDGTREAQFALSMAKDPDQFAENTQAIFKQPDQISQDEVELINGTFLSRTTSPVKDAAGKYYGRIWVFQDFTKRRKLEDQLRQSQKMEAVGQLTGGIAHDFNNLLAIVLGNLELLEMIVEGHEPALRRVNAARMAAERGADVTRRLLAFSRSGELRPAPTRLHQSLQNVIALARTLGPDLRFNTRLDESIPPILVDPSGLENALLNIIVNARDAMPAGGTVNITTQSTLLDESYPLVKAGDLASGRHVSIVISDAGMGMSKEVAARVFEPFYTTKDQGKGTGLGLAMVYGFVRQSGGAIRVYSEEGVGTTVSIYLPLQQDLAMPPTAAPVARSTEKQVGKVLILDDEPDLVEVAEMHLRGMGYTVYTAITPDAALQIAREHPDLDLLLTDIIMPGGMNGVQFASHLRALLPSIKIIYSSGFPANAMADRGFAAFEGMMLRKPYLRTDFEAAVREVMAQ